MRSYILIPILVMCISLPTSAHAIGILKYAWDSVANQLGLDRGAIPKVLPKCDVPRCDRYGKRIPKHAYRPNFHLQAEGF